MENLINTWVYVKFGKYHGKKAKILGITTKNENPAFLLQLEDGTEFVKSQKNTVRLLPTNK